MRSGVCVYAFVHVCLYVYVCMGEGVCATYKRIGMGMRTVPRNGFAER